ncbi:hypothetical protein JVU11DRAFT_3504 [Chiua virens]|nr:hypothetical protein JVU11DRAFT_3504 [Chiua virens]
MILTEGPEFSHLVATFLRSSLEIQMQDVTAVHMREPLDQDGHPTPNGVCACLSFCTLLWYVCSSLLIHRFHRGSGSPHVAVVNASLPSLPEETCLLATGTWPEISYPHPHPHPYPMHVFFPENCAMRRTDVPRAGTAICLDDDDAEVSWIRIRCDDTVAVTDGQPQTPGHHAYLRVERERRTRTGAVTRASWHSRDRDHDTTNDDDGGGTETERACVLDLERYANGLDGDACIDGSTTVQIVWTDKMTRGESCLNLDASSRSGGVPASAHRGPGVAGATGDDPYEAHGVGVVIKALVQQNPGASMLVKMVVYAAAFLYFAHSAFILGEWTHLHVFLMPFTDLEL